jgi:hypothetical protein
MGRNFYRLSQTDFNGQKEILGTVSAKAMSRLSATTAGPVVAPNPFGKHCTVCFETEQAWPVTVKLLTMTSRPVYSCVQAARPGENCMNLELPADVPAGNYVLQVWYPGGLIGSAHVIRKEE